MRTLHIKSNAKINLTLEIAGRRSDGYHELHSVMAAIPLYDHLYIKKRTSGFRLKSNEATLRDERDNILFKAWAAYKNYFGFEGGVSVHLIKNIPIGAGLGGGSGNCAAFLKALYKMQGLPKRYDSELLALSAQLGADVPFLMRGGCAIAQGVGERLSPLPSLRRVTLVLVQPPFAFLTGKMYTLYDELPIDETKAQASGVYTMRMAEAVRAKDTVRIANYLYNDFETVAQKLNPEIADIKRLLIQGGALNALMTGSGSVVFGMYLSQKRAARTVKQIRSMGNMRAMMIRIV